MNSKAWAGKVAIVTGTGSGIGAAVARRLREEGVAVAGLDLAPSSDVSLSLSVDLRDDAAVREAVEATALALGQATILIHCAGISPPGSILESDDALFRDTYDTNVISAVRLMRHVVPGMRDAGGGAVVMTTSINARFATPGLAAYAASKAALESLVRTAALEFSAWQVRVNGIAPASVDTPMLRASFERADDPIAAREANVGRHPLGRLGTADDVAELAIFLASDASGWMTGGIYPIDGGASVTRR
ncbi:SDR family NAD(P)-dependent oxidoreductase [Luteibacter aegosomatissinici]|uniref:SDR family NAD(P)-dependent oxidoreductase n=1 Tax=Luteibacter aegosomatissinici TaxID=2911539 RepID=UPI001FFACFBD|nr:SDR family oxidoreductase [Luteibacter aegosomatissinici]UPG94589.1 SDR family oxidoreductase [Luteibacter aegosomatissinici]